MSVAMLFLAAAVAVAAAVDVSMSLRDHPIAATGTPNYLDGGVWTASTQHPVGADYHDDQPPGLNLTVTATVPGDLLTDLQRAGVIADPWYVPGLVLARGGGGGCVMVVVWWWWCDGGCVAAVVVCGGTLQAMAGRCCALGSTSSHSYA